MQCTGELRSHESTLNLEQNQRPPPAQAQAQPAQAQAQAHPPPLRPELLERLGGGGGLVRFVIELVNSVTLPTTPLEKFCTPCTMEAAKVDPGRVGSERPPPPGLPVEGMPTVDGLGAEVDGR